jgi:hypothetical protein
MVARWPDRPARVPPYQFQGEGRHFPQSKRNFIAIFRAPPLTTPVSTHDEDARTVAFLEQLDNGAKKSG